MKYAKMIRCTARCVTSSRSCRCRSHSRMMLLQQQRRPGSTTSRASTGSAKADILISFRARESARLASTSGPRKEAQLRTQGSQNRGYLSPLNSSSSGVAMVTCDLVKPATSQVRACTGCRPRRMSGCCSRARTKRPSFFANSSPVGEGGHRDGLAVGYRIHDTDCRTAQLERAGEGPYPQL